MDLRGYQKTFIENISFSINQHKRVIAQLATGGGKTVTFSVISKKFIEKNQKKVLILVHRIELLKQAAATIEKNTGIKAVPIIAGIKKIPEAEIYVGMVETISRRFDKLPDFGLIIIDEAHISNFKKIINYYNDKYIIGFTATPLNATKKDPLKNYFNSIVCAVDIPDLIKDGYLCQAQTFAPKQEVERVKLKMKGGDFDPAEMAQIYSAQKYVESTVEVYKKIAINTKTLVFNCSVSHSLLVTEAFIKAGFDCKHLDGESSDRDEVLNWFANTPNAILCNVFITTTGFDQPDVQTVIVNKATASMPMWLQMCGRGSRPAENKNSFTIIDMGANTIEHGKWEEVRDWNYIFRNPKKAKDGIAPMKKCPDCDGYIHARKMVCDIIISSPEEQKPCGYVFPVKEITDPGIDKVIQVAGSIDLYWLVKKAEVNNHNEYSVLHRIIQKIVDACDKMTPDIYQAAQDEALKLGAEWSKQKSKRFNQWNKDWIKSNLENKINTKFTSWKKS